MAPLLRDTVEPLLRETEPVPAPLLRETVEPLLRAVVPVPEVPRVAAEPLRVTVEPVERTAEVPARVAPGAAERETLVRPVEDRRVARLPPVVAVLPPARVRPLLRVRPLPRDAPPRETRLRVLREPSRWPTWKAWLFRWIQRPLHPPTP